MTIVRPSLTATPFLARHLDVTATISDYYETARATLAEVDELPAPAYNDPAGVADAIVAAADLEDPALRLATGKQSTAESKAALNARLAELGRWAELSSRAGAPVLAS
jgi:hypothetical protein